MLRCVLLALLLTGTCHAAAPDGVQHLRTLLSESLAHARVEFIGLGVNHYQVDAPTANGLRRLEKSLAGRFGIFGERDGHRIAGMVRSLRCGLAQAPGGPRVSDAQAAATELTRIYRTLDIELARLAVLK